MERPRRTSTVRQLELLVEFAESHKDCALGRLRSKEARAVVHDLWQECATKLNREGPARTPKEWCKVWNDMKSRVRVKFPNVSDFQSGTAGECGNALVSFTALEKRVAELLGRDLNAITNGVQEKLQVTPEESQNVAVQFVDVMQEYKCDLKSNGVSLEDEQLARPSSHSSPFQPSHSSPETPHSPSQLKHSPPHSPSFSRPPSVLEPSTPPRQRPRPRQRFRYRPQSRLAALELRANTDALLAQAALRQAEAAKSQAEASLIAAKASKLQAETLARFCHALMPALQRFLISYARAGRSRPPPSSDEEE